MRGVVVICLIVLQILGIASAPVNRYSDDGVEDLEAISDRISGKLTGFAINW